MNKDDRKELDELMPEELDVIAPEKPDLRKEDEDFLKNSPYMDPEIMGDAMEMIEEAEKLDNMPLEDKPFVYPRKPKTVKQIKRRAASKRARKARKINRR